MSHFVPVLDKTCLEFIKCGSQFRSDLVFGAIWLKNTHFKKTICAFKSAPFYNESIPFQRKDAL